MKTSRLITAFYMASILLAVLGASLFIVQRDGYLLAAKQEFVIAWNGAAIDSPKGLPILARRMLLRAIEDGEFQSMNLRVTDKLLTQDAAPDGAHAHFGLRFNAPTCTLSIHADPVIFPLGELHGKQYQRKKWMDFQFTVFHEAAHCVYRSNLLSEGVGHDGLTTAELLARPATLREESFADIYAFVMLHRYNGASVSFLNTLDSWTLIRSHAEDDSTHDSSAALSRLRDDITSGKVDYGSTEMFAMRYALQLIDTN